ncbi:YfhO family protein [Chryseosolibacter indicus]|uniref:YfhO family protein n=1 Tax=Chryseosolibacter indicus TaxID=2782351 RepID=A0ABS5VQT2_9BACT|nr:YfhO family protein [Chryseosolibacter indicus]MBT1703511.1 YfhO family protein [Chryseosolibacter indicus]
MKKIRFAEHVLPHIVAIAVFLLVTVFFFNPVFFDNRTLEQHDIQMFQGAAKSIQDYRQQTGEEALWTNSMFGGMPAYMVSVIWGNQTITFLKKIISVGMPHPINNIFIAFLCYYIMLLAFKVRPYLAIAGAIAFGLSSYVIIGLSAGHNARIGAIALMPLVVAGIHLVFSGKRLLGLGVTAAGLALQLRENHIQITYYLVIVVFVYGLIRFIEAVREKNLSYFFKTIGVLLVALLLAAGSYFGQFWSISEYAKYSIRGKSDLAGSTPQQQTADALGMSKSYAFEFSNGILEPLTLLIPNIFGGSSGISFLQDEKSATYRALVNSGDQQLANQLVNFTTGYWGEQRLSAPYYAGAIIVFLFAVGIAFAEKKYVWWLGALAVLSIVLSWGSNFAAFNYLLFDYLPGYNKFRSVTFTLVIILFAMPLLGLLGLEKLWQRGIDKESKRKLLIAFASTGGICLFFLIFGGMLSFTREQEAQLPAWFANALAEDRLSLLRSDAFRSLAFITIVFVILYFDLGKKISTAGLYAFLILIITIDLAIVDKRYFSNDQFKRKRESANFFAMTPADQEILKDKSYYRVYQLNPRNPFDAFNEAKTSYHHNSIGGYHGAKLRRYQEYLDSCFYKEIQKFFAQAQQQNYNFDNLHGFNMLNVKYLPYGTEREAVLVNHSANGNAWFVNDVVKVNSAAEELKQTCDINTKTTAVIDVSRFKLENVATDSTGIIKLTAYKPNYLKYESNSSTGGLAVFSEIYYPKGWIATVDGKETNIYGANYILRAIQIPAGEHAIEFKFQPDVYTVGNKVTMASSWLVLLVLLGSIGWSLKEEKDKD